MKKITAMVLGGLLAMSASGTVFADAMDLTMEESVRIALDNNHTVKQQEAAFDKAVWARHEARRQMGPTIGLSSAYQRGRAIMIDDDANTYTNGISLTMPIYTGGQLEGAIKAADLSMDSAQLNLELTKQQVKATTMSNYYKALQAKNQIKVAQDSVDTLTEHMKNVNAQFAVGTVAKSDVLSTAVQMANAEQSLITANNDYDVALATLNNSMGIPTDTELNLTDSLEYVTFTIPLEECTAYARDNRPAVLIADYAVETAKAQVQVARAGYLPTVNASVSRNWAGDTPFSADYGYNDPSGLYSSNTWGAGVSISWNIWDNNITQAKVKEAEADVLSAEVAADQARQTGDLEVRTAYLNLKAAEKSISTNEVAVEQAKEDYKIAQARYEAGVGTNLDVMDAQEKLTTAQTNYYTALYNYNSSKSELDRAMGIMVDFDLHTLDPLEK